MMKMVDLRPLGLIIALFTLHTCLCSGQITIGLSGGGGFTQSTGFRAAMPLEIRRSEHLSFFGGPAFIQRRNPEMVRKLPSSRDYLSAEVDYLSMPIQLKARLDWTPIRIYGLAGIEINYGLRLQATGIEDQRLFKEKVAFAPVEISRLDGGFCFGAGFETDLHRNRKIFADLRYYLGILDIDRSDLGEIYNEGVYVTLGFMFPILVSR